MLLFIIYRKCQCSKRIHRIFSTSTWSIMLCLRYIGCVQMITVYTINRLVLPLIVSSRSLLFLSLTNYVCMQVVDECQWCAHQSAIGSMCCCLVHFYDTIIFIYIFCSPFKWNMSSWYGSWKSFTTIRFFFF